MTFLLSDGNQQLESLDLCHRKPCIKKLYLQCIQSIKCFTLFFSSYWNYKEIFSHITYLCLFPNLYFENAAACHQLCSKISHSENKDQYLNKFDTNKLKILKLNGVKSKFLFTFNISKNQEFTPSGNSINCSFSKLPRFSFQTTLCIFKLILNDSEN